MGNFSCKSSSAIDTNNQEASSGRRTIKDDKNIPGTSNKDLESKDASCQTPERQDAYPVFQLRPGARSVLTPGKVELIPVNEEEETELGLVLIGLVGSGKSSAGNLIIGSEVFYRKTVNTLDTSFTQTIQRSYQKFGGKTVAVIDTPGIPVINAHTDRDKVILDLKTAKEEVNKIPHAFILIISLENYLPPKFLRFLEKRRGDILDSLIVILTRDNDTEVDLNSKSFPLEIRKFIEQNKLQFMQMKCKYLTPEPLLDTFTKKKIRHLLQMCEYNPTTKRNGVKKHEQPLLVNLNEV